MRLPGRREADHRVGDDVEDRERYEDERYDDEEDAGADGHPLAGLSQSRGGRST